MCPLFVGWIRWGRGWWWTMTHPLARRAARAQSTNACVRASVCGCTLLRARTNGNSKSFLCFGKSSSSSLTKFVLFLGCFSFLGGPKWLDEELKGCPRGPGSITCACERKQIDGPAGPIDCQLKCSIAVVHSTSRWWNEDCTICSSFQRVYEICTCERMMSVLRFKWINSSREKDLITDSPAFFIPSSNFKSN